MDTVRFIVGRRDDLVRRGWTATERSGLLDLSAFEFGRGITKRLSDLVRRSKAEPPA